MGTEKDSTMDNEHLILQDYTENPWSKDSITRQYLEQLPLANVDDYCKETETRCLLPRKNIFIFGLQNGITEPVIYYSCKLCPVIIKPHDVKSHMLTHHPTQESTPTPAPTQSTSLPSSSGTKQKKTTHKNKKKIIPPPSVPPPPLFPKIDSTQRSSTSAVSMLSNMVTEDLLPPILQPAEPIVINSTSDRLTSEKPEDATKITKQFNLPPPLTTEVSTPASSMLPPPPAVLPPKVKEKSVVKTDKSSSNRHRRSKRSKNLDFDPDKHCGVLLDSVKQPCMRALTCAIHTIVERRAVVGRSRSLDKLITEYKASRIKNKPTSILPISIAPKQTSSKEVRNGFNLIDLLYDCEDQFVQNNRQSDDSLVSSALDDLTTRVQSLVSTLPTDNSHFFKSVKITTTTEAGSKCGRNNEDITLTTQTSSTSTTTTTSILRTALTQPSLPIPIGKLSDNHLQTMPMVYNLHPKPMTMPTAPLHRVGTSFVLQQGPRLDRQRMDLQAVVNQHKQLKPSVNKSISLINSNHNKQSLLKSSVKTNTKINPVKRPNLDKSNLNDIKNVKIIATDVNGFLLNSEFTDSNETTVTDKVALLK